MAETWVSFISNLSTPSSMQVCQSITQSMVKHDAKATFQRSFQSAAATRAKGIFRVSGSAKRVSELQLIFDTPPKYGSQLDWSGYTIHDASNVLRRYLNHLPDPVIPLEFYEKFRDVHRNLTDEDEQIAAYQELISKLPPPHSCLLMYLLDLLALFAHHSEENLMDSKNLASVFQPGVISHPGHSMSPGEYMTSAAVLKFLIDHQSSFTMPKPNIDEEDEEMANFGLMDQPPQHRLPINNRDSFGAAFRAGGYVNASDHERIHNTMVDRGVSFEADDAVHILNSGVRRQLSLHKPIIPHSTLPGNPPQRSKSTNSSTSSHHSNHSGLFSSSFLARRRSNRNSKTGSKIMGEGENFSSLNTVPQEQDLSDVPENARLREEKQRSSTSRTSSVRKAATSPLIGVDESGSELTSGPHKDIADIIDAPWPFEYADTTAGQQSAPISAIEPTEAKYCSQADFRNRTEFSCPLL
ncbi:hypothetical protein EDD11_001652 [Mortierella claussenii]|nr:hypothetical protein EDD11_001652 [Mortierella claussenii]